MSFKVPAAPTGALGLGRVTSAPQIGPATMVYLVSTTSIAQAWKKVRANKGAPGIDGVDIEQFPRRYRRKWKICRQQLLDGTYVPTPVKRVEIPKESGGMRKLGIPIVMDRVIMQAIAQILVQEFDHTFSDHSYGYRPGRSVQMAARKAQEYYQQGYHYQIDIDLAKFFDTVNHDVLMDRVTRRVRDKRILKLIGKFLRAGVVVNGRLQATRRGVPQGSPCSPILSNVLLDDLDKELEHRGHKFVRYADDLAVFVKSPRAGERVMANVSRYLEQKLRVTVNKEKSKVQHARESAVLGFHIHQKKLRATDIKVRNFKAELKSITRRCPGISIASRIHRLRQYIQGWMAHYGCGLKYNDAVKLDQWIRRRLRMCYWKQWRKPRTRIRNLILLGVSTKDAIAVGMSRKSYWRLAKTLSTNSGLNNDYFRQMGLISVREVWCRIHHPATAR